MKTDVADSEPVRKTLFTFYLLARFQNSGQEVSSPTCLPGASTFCFVFFFRFLRTESLYYTSPPISFPGEMKPCDPSTCEWVISRGAPASNGETRACDHLVLAMRRYLPTYYGPHVPPG